MSELHDNVGVLTIQQITDAVGDDPGLAQLAKDAELARGEDNVRTTLISALDKVLAGSEAVDDRHGFADGGEPYLGRLAAGVVVEAVIDRYTNRILDPTEYEVTAEGHLVKADGGDWAAGVQRWAVVRED